MNQKRETMYYSSPFPNVRLIHRSTFIHDVVPNRSYEIYTFYTSIQKCILSAVQGIVMYKMPEAVRTNKASL